MAKKKSKPKAKTYNAGANEARSKIRRKLKRMMRDSGVEKIDGVELLHWLNQQDERWRKRPGGL